MGSDFWRDFFSPNTNLVTALYCLTTSPGSLLPTEAVPAWHRLGHFHLTPDARAGGPWRLVFWTHSILSHFRGPPRPPLGSSSLGLRCDDASDLIAILWSSPGRGPSQASPRGRRGGGGYPPRTSTEWRAGCIETNSENHEDGGNQGLGAKDQDGLGEEGGRPT